MNKSLKVPDLAHIKEINGKSFIVAEIDGRIASLREATQLVTRMCNLKLVQNAQPSP